MARWARDLLVDLGERRRKLFSEETALWKIHSAWDPWQMKVGGEKRVGRTGRILVLVISVECRRNTPSPRGPSL